MSLTGIATLLRDEPALGRVLGSRQAVLAVAEPARAVVVAGLCSISARRPLLVATPTTAESERLVADLTTFLGPNEVEAFPAWETLPFERMSPAVETMGRRLRVLWRLRHPEFAPSAVVAPVRALLQRLGPHVEDVEPTFVRAGRQFDVTELVDRLVGLGYRRDYQVEHRGDVAVRGSIVDIFPSTADAPVRLDFWGDEVERLTEFSVTDQRSVRDIDAVAVFPCRELLPTPEVRDRSRRLVGREPWGREQWDRLAEGQHFDGMESWLPWLVEEEHVLTDVVPPEGQVVLVDPRRMRDRASDILAEEADLAETLAGTWGAEGQASTGFPALHLSFDRLLAHTEAPAWTLTSAPEGPEVDTVLAGGWDPVVGDGSDLVRRLSEQLRDGFRVLVGAETEASARRVATLLSDRDLEFVLDLEDRVDLTRPGGAIRVAPLERGFVLPSLRLSVLAETDVTGRRRAHRRARPRRRDAERFFEDLAPGDYVVHHHHGVARYGGMVTRSIGGVEKDYLLLQYRGDDRLYVPSDQIDAVRHYTGGESPALSRMGGSDFQRTKAKVRSAVQEIAQELVVLYQRRVTSEGFAFSTDTPWQREMEQSFPYQETPDQLRAVEDVKGDMERPVPMDRLVCGDVGFGKTEVAVRAAFKAVQDGKQVAVLVPTTLLAHQHLQTFSDRLAAYPVRIEALSRFLTPGQQRDVVKGVASGEVDLVIGTHRLLSDDVAFRDLGLLVVDEEQRFGVQHKERLKTLQTSVDVLTLTATPIPRTLEMSLTGIRDFSVINTAPADRQPILTYVGGYDDRAAAEAIRRELLREGQVFFVHNRVADIELVAADLRELVGEARIAVAHGQMDEGSLEQVVLDFWEGRFDVLVCTTIIESGIDMPTVNTLVVDRADRLGLGQMHQLRGRVGRAGQRAYAYLFTPEDKVLSEEAHERLKTIGETTELGSGFKIAMRDLEIRGAGNLLGTGQSGHIAAVGYDLYCQMVNEAVAELKGEPLRESAEIKLDLPIDAYLPEEYVAREDLRLEAYRRLAAVTTQEEVDDTASEWNDRYGPTPQAAEALLRVASLRAECVRTGVREVTVARGPAFGRAMLTARLSPLTLPISKQARLERLYHGAVYKEEVGELQVPLDPEVDPADALVVLLGELVPELTATGAADDRSVAS